MVKMNAKWTRIKAKRVRGYKCWHIGGRGRIPVSWGGWEASR
jgi:hypothetical protein